MSGDRYRLDRREVLRASAGAATALLGFPLAHLAGASAAPQRLGSQPFDAQWRFYRGECQGAETREFDDGRWRMIDLPHDWSIEDLPASSGAADETLGPFSRKSLGASATGFTIGGEGWYRKRFRLAARTGSRVELLFEGVYMDADVWLNGRQLATHWYGYTPWAVDLTGHLSSSGDNVLAVHVRNTGRNSRWYSGSGIYRHVWLDVWPERTRIARWGVGIATRQADAASADLELNVRVDDTDESATLSYRVLDETRQVVRAASGKVNAMHEHSMTILSPRLWSPTSPSLYTLITELKRGDRLLDRVESIFGVRVIAFNAETGMTINGVSTKLRGGCIHHDNGLIGAAAFDSAEERKVRLLKVRGFNAVRPSHNPFSPAFVGACDRLGVLIVAETFDAWREHKLPEDYATRFEQDWQSDLTSLVLSARNHPSIVMWSIGNEIPERNTARGIETQWQLANEVHRLDPTRPVTAAINDFAGHPVRASTASARAGATDDVDSTSAVFLDVVGYNYKLADYEADHRQYPQRVFFGTESFAKDMPAIWELTERSPWLVGDFVWTAMDYLGEAGIGGSAIVPERLKRDFAPRIAAWPWVNAYSGDIDLIGRQKAPSLARDVVWGLSPLEILVQRPLAAGKADVPTTWGWHDEHCSWSWPGAEGQPLTIRLYAAADRVELRLNGRRIENQSMTRTGRLLRVEYTAVYEPGTLEAAAFLENREIARRELTTAGAAAALHLAAESPQSDAGRGGLSFVRIEVVDAAGRWVPDVSKPIQLSIDGPAELIALGSAYPFASGSLQSPSSRTWDGRALAVLRSKGRAGAVLITGTGEGLAPGTAQVRLA